MSETRLVKCETLGCDTLIAPDGRGEGRRRTMCTKCWRRAREPRRQGRKPPTLARMLRNASLRH